MSTVTWLLWPGLTMNTELCPLSPGHEHRDLSPLLAVGKPLCGDNTNAFPCLSQLWANPLSVWRSTQTLFLVCHSCGQTLSLCGGQHKRFSLSVTAVGKPSLCVEINTNAFPCHSCFPKLGNCACSVSACVYGFSLCQKSFHCRMNRSVCLKSVLLSE